MKIQRGADSQLNKNLDQFFLEDREVLQSLVESTQIQDNEVVLEIGAGDGRITRLLAKKAKKVVAIEVDKRWEPELKKLPGEVEIIIDEALGFLAKKPPRKFDKIVGNLPSNLVEPLFQRLAKINFNFGVFLVPEKFAHKMGKIPGFNLYFRSRLIAKIPKRAFTPIPRTNWELIALTRIDPLKIEDLNLYLRRYVFEHPKAKLRNSLREGIFKYWLAKGKKLTKNQARHLVQKLGISSKTLAFLPSEVPFDQLSQKLKGNC